VDVSIAAGLFRFEATDYYYPNFYTEAGFRGEIAVSHGASKTHSVKLFAAGYPMDDNIFDPGAEYCLRWPLLSVGPFITYGVPAAGFQLTKLQYPAPYYPTVDHQFLPWLRAGGDAAIAFSLSSRTTLTAVYRARLLYYLGSAFFINEEGTPERFKYLQTPLAELHVEVAPRWSLLARSGWEYGGYYDDLFVPPDDLPSGRPYFEAGASYAF